jgi:GGDEF domain-containing protein
MIRLIGSTPSWKQFGVLFRVKIADTGNEMKRHLLRVYAVVVVFVILAIATSVFWRVHAIRAAQYQRAATSFGSISSTTATLWQSEALSNASAALARELAKYRETPPVMISIYDAFVGVDYLWSVDERYIPPASDLGRFSPAEMPRRDYLHARFTRSFSMPDGERRVIIALYPLLGRGVLYPILRDAFIAAVILVVVSALIALVGLFGRQDLTIPQKTPAEPAGDHENEQGRKEVHEQDDEPSDAATNRVAEAEAEVKNDATPATPATPATSATSATPATPEGSVPGILHPESHLLERLNDELERAGFSEQDMSIAVFQFNQGTRGDPAHRENCEAIRSFFVFKDLCFEFGDDGAAVLIPNATLQDALGLVERFQRHYWELRTRWDRESADFHCGVSSRNVRLVEGDRILEECRAALRRSWATPGKIVGFQPDPRKYREFLAS